MSALSKFSTMKRPRWPGGTGGAVGGAAGTDGGAWAAMRGASGFGTSVRGPTESGGVLGPCGGGAPVAGGGATSGGGTGGMAAVRGGFDTGAHPLTRATATTTAMLLLTLLLRGISRGRLREATQKIRWQRTAPRNDRRSDLPRLGNDAGLSGYRGGLRGRGQRWRRGWQGRGRWNHAGQRLVDGRLRAGYRRRRRLAHRAGLVGIAQAHVHLAVRPVDRHAVGGDSLHGAAGHGVADAIA